jgi:hypothetical protein
MGWWVVEVVVYACFWGCCESFCFLIRFNRNKAINFPFLLDLICCVMGELCITMSFLNHMDKISQNSNPCNVECIILFLALKGYALSSRQSEIPSPLTQSTNSQPPSFSHAPEPSQQSTSSIPTIPWYTEGEIKGVVEGNTGLTVQHFRSLIRSIIVFDLLILWN